MRMAPNPLIRGVATVYIEIFRGTSLLVQLYWIFFVLPLFGITLEKFTAGFVAVGMNLGAYGAELVRGASCRYPRDSGRRRWRSTCRRPSACGALSCRRR